MKELSKINKITKNQEIESLTTNKKKQSKSDNLKNDLHNIFSETIAFSSNYS